jgi:hypothetical protein
MNTTINALLAAIAVTAPASAAPRLLVKTTITQTSAKGDKDVWAAPRVIVESGKEGITQLGNQLRMLEYAVTPTLLDNGTVDVRAVLTERNDGKKAEKLAAPRIKARLGEKAEIRVGNVAFQTITSLAK